jgi:hypothetical protein
LAPTTPDATTASTTTAVVIIWSDDKPLGWADFGPFFYLQQKSSVEI